MHRLVLGNPLAAFVVPILLAVVAHKLLNKRRASAPRNAEDPNPGAPRNAEDPNPGAPRNAEDPNPGAPSRSIPAIGRHYDVFLSFRGVDTRRGFVDHLYHAFHHAGIDAFRDDDELRQGDSISSDLLEAIQNSKILIPIISPNYASSKWCLQQLVYMMDCMKRSGRIVLPIFYRVAPSDVRYGRGSFGEAFRYYCKRFVLEDVEKWKQALGEVAYLKGWESEKVANGHEGELVTMIVRNVLKELEKGHLVVSDHLVGIDIHLENVMKLIDYSSGATRSVGIYGLGGIGKTTLVKVIYNMLSHQFESCTFIADINESCKRKSILYLQNKLIFDLLKIEIQLYDYHQGIQIISSRLARKKVLLILDDVATSDEIKALAGNPNWFGPGSRILVTTRNKSVLDRAGVDIKYQLEEMDEEQSLVLFSRHAFRKDSPPDEFLALSCLVVSITGGLPLALEVVASLLCGKGKSLWRDVIQKMQKVPHSAVREKLRISYEELDFTQRQIYLDIACFLIGSDARVASYMWDACCYHPMEGIEVLRSLSFINIGDNHELIMQNQMRDLGRDLVRQENYSEPCQRSRLWDYEEALEVLQGKEITLNVEAIYLEKGYSTRNADEDGSGCVKDQGSSIFRDEQFRNLQNLRFLHMSDVNLIGDFKNTFSKLLWLKWGNCSPTFEADNFHPKRLVILDLSGSLISDHWQGWSSMKSAEKLKVLNLTGCGSLKSTSYLSAFQSLEILILRDCGKLEQIDPCIGDVETLVSLDLSGCLRLKELPPQVGKLGQLKELLLDKTMIQEFPSSIGSLKKLEMLSAKDCKSLLELPLSIGRLVNLRSLSLRCCCQLIEIPNSFGKLEMLTQLDLSGCSIYKIPSSIGYLVNLQRLSLRCCRQLREIPESIGNLVMLTQLDLSGCSIYKIPSSIGNLLNLRRLSLRCCCQLREIPNSIGNLEMLTQLDLSGCSIYKIPSSIGSLKKLETLSAKYCRSLILLPDSLGDLVKLLTLFLTGCVDLEVLPDSIGHLVDLQCLSLGCCQRLREISNSIGDLKLLTRLDLSGCSRLKELPPRMGELEQLKELLLDQTMIREIPSSFGSLKKLETLSAKHCKSLLGLPDSIGPLVNLSTLVLSGCVKLVALPDSIGALQNLEILNISHTEIQELPIGIGRLRKLRNLDASACTKLRGGVTESFCNLSSLQRLDFQGCKELPLLPELPSSLTYLSFTCRCGSFFPASFKLEILQIHECKFMDSLDVSQLQHLQKLYVESCNNILEVRGLDKLKYLESLTITDGDLIERLDLSESEGLKKLHTKNCKRLVEIRGIDRLGFLEELNISGCASIEMLHLPKSGGLKILDAGNCKYLIEIQGLNRLEFLERLNICGCTSFERLPNLSCFNTLQKLAINNCDKLHDIQSLETFMSCTSLWIEDCTSLAKLPNLSNFHTLQKLFLSNCHELQEIPGLEESTSLKHIAISGCSSIEILPDLSSCTNLISLVVQNCEILTELQGLEKLEQLVELDISGCKSLKAIPKFSGTQLYQNYEKKPFESDHGTIEFGEDNLDELFGEDDSNDLFGEDDLNELKWLT